MSDFKFNFENEDQELMDNLKHLQINNSDKDYIDRSHDEYVMIKDIILKTKPKTILDIGAGIGRSSVYLKNVAELDDTKFYLADFNGKEFDKKGGCGDHENADPIPYNDLGVTKSFCQNNNMNMDNVDIINLGGNDLSNVGKVDVIYSFHCIGFHWSIEDAFEKYKLSAHCHDDTVIVFGVRVHHKLKKFPEEIGNFKLKTHIPGDFLQRYLVYTKKKK